MCRQSRRIRDHQRGLLLHNWRVYVNFFDASQDELVWRIRPGGSSSNATSFPDERFVCTES
ncbi:hypothetical protein [Streptomyces acidiscabies]|uniref:Uncharacterized protein n=1 Tax=Streptomyces acidiscabies TaxID=42234 RepID=A0ABU4MFC8_9ACTN|nr:hypothetical protein [Streptomyces acidiscabies]MDX3025942.1 hypothetical protein [Streptomyces acidiscabies]